MFTKVRLNWKQVEEDCNALADIIGPCDVMVAIGRGGLVPGVMMSHILDCPVYNFGIKTYKEDNTYGKSQVTQIPGIKFNSEFRDKRVIVFDDLSDRGTTLIEAKNYFEQNVFKNYKFATLYIKKSTKFMPNFYLKEFADDLWLDFPWETVKLK